MRPVDGWHSLSKHVTRKHLLGFCCGRLPHIHTVVCFHLLRTHEWVSLGFTIAFEVLQFQFHPWHCVCRMNHHNTTSTNGTSLVYFVVMVWKLLNKRNFDIAAFSDRCLQTGVFFWQSENTISPLWMKEKKTGERNSVGWEVFEMKDDVRKMSIESRVKWHFQVFAEKFQIIQILF